MVAGRVFARYPMTRASRPGLTMIELMAVIAISGIFFCLLISAISKVREAAARTQCINNLRQVGLAVHSYAGVEKKLPRYATGRAGEIYGSWVIGLLPYLDHGVHLDVIYTTIYEWDVGNGPR